MRNHLIVVGFVLVILNEFRIAEAVDINVNNNFEGGELIPWMEQSKSGVKWKIENTTSTLEPDNKAPPPLSGTKYLRVDRGTSLAFGVAILRSPVFKIPAGSDSIFFSFSFWIRSKWPQFTNLELYLAKNGNEGLLLPLYEYSNVNNQIWRQPEPVIITDDMSSNLTLVFYAYCGTSPEDAVAIDDLYFIPLDTTTPESVTTTSSAVSTRTSTSSSSTTDSTSSSTVPTTSSTTISTNTTQTTARPTLTPTTERTRPTLTSTPTTASSPEITTTYATLSTEEPVGTTEETTTATTSTDEPTTTTDEPTTTTEPTTTLAEEKCPDFLQEDAEVPCWVVETKCYCFYIGSKQQNWTVANEFCRGGNMNLLAIETEEEDELIYDHVNSTPEIPNNVLYWIGGRYSQEGNDRWEWASNDPFLYEPFSYDNWAISEPNINQTSDKFCTYVIFYNDFNGGYWFDDPCSVEGSKFICELND